MPIRLANSAVAPSAPPPGFTDIFTTSNGILATIDPDGSISQVGAGGSGSGVNYSSSPTAPTDPSIGDYWANSSNGRLYFFAGTAWAELSTPASTTLNDLAGVELTTPAPTTDSVLGFDGSNWVPKRGTKFTKGAISPANPVDGDFWFDLGTNDFYVCVNGGWFEVSSAGGGSNYLASLLDVNLTGIQPGQTLVWDGSRMVPGNGALSLNGLSDVVIAAPAAGETVVFNGVEWRNGPVQVALSGLTDVDGAIPPVKGQTLTYGGAGKWIPSGMSYSFTVSTTSPASPTDGMFWADPSNDYDLYYYAGNQWRNVIAPPPPTPCAIVSDTPPANPDQGTLWLNSTNMRLAVWVAQADAWVFFENKQ